MVIVMSVLMTEVSIVQTGQSTRTSVRNMRRGSDLMTNGDKIRSMSDMELSRELCKISGVCSECLVQDMCDKGHTGFEQWLKEEVSDDE